MYEIRLGDNRLIVRHLDQLHPREGAAKPTNSAMEEATVGGDTRTTVPESEPINDTRDSEELEPTVVPQQAAVEDRMSTLTESGTTTVSPLQTEVSQERPQTGTQTGTTGTPLRRSTRSRQPPLRYDGRSV